MKEFINDVSEIFSRLSKEIDEVKANLENVKIEAKKAELTGQEIQRKVNEFQVLAQPKVDKINEILEKLSEKSSVALVTTFSSDEHKTECPNRHQKFGR